MGDEKKEEDEKKVPVFTVFKKDSILKNIFLDAPQTNSRTSEEDEDEQVILIGRHPDCSITLDHPSISRFHLRLHSNPSSLKLSLVDLSSVHGTWVSGKKVEPGVQVDLNEGDIVQLGGSSRLYVLHWVSVSRAYDLDVPFVPPMNVLMNVKETEELSNQDENCCSSIETNQIQSKCTSVGDLDLSISKIEITVSSSSPTMPEFVDSTYDNEEAKEGNLYREECKQNEISGISAGQRLKEKLIEDQHSDEDSENLPNASSPSNDHNKDLCREEEHKENEISGFSSGTLLKESAVTKFKNQQSDEEHEENQIYGFSSGTPLKESAVTNLENQQSDEELDENEISGFSSGTLSEESAVTKFENQQSDEEHEENEISGFSFGTPLKESAVTKFENQQSDEENDENPQALAGLLNGTSHERSLSVYHNKNLLGKADEENEVSAFSSRQLLNESVLEIVNQQFNREHENSQAISGIANVNSPTINNNEHSLREDHQISAFSPGQLLNKSVVEIEYQQYDEEYENSQDLNGALSGIAEANSTSIIDHYEHPLREEFEENEISAFSSGQLLNESVAEIKYLQYDGEYEKSQPLDGVLSGIANANSSPSTDHYAHRLLREEFEEHEISALLFGQLLNESVLETEYQQYDEVCENLQAVDGVLSSIADADSIPTIYHNEHQLKEELEKNEISASTSVLLLSESVVEIGDQQSVVEMGNQQCNEDCEKSQAVDGIPSSVANAHSLCQTHHVKNLPKFFNSSFSDEDVEIIYASRMQNEQVKMSTSGCYSPCSSTILEQDNNVQYSLSSGIHEIQSSKNTPSKSEQESDWPEIMRHSLYDVCAVVGEISEALDKESSLKGDNKQKEITVITGDCFEQLDEKINTKETFVSTSGCYSLCSSTILEQDNNVQYSLSSGIHEIQSSKNTPSKSEQESDWPEIMRHSLYDVCAVVGEISEALDKESSLKGDNKQKEITVITGDCFEQLDEKINTKETFATNVSEPKDTDFNTPLSQGEQSGSPRSTRVKPTSINIQTGKWFPTSTEVKQLYKDDVDYESVSEALISNVEVFAEEIFTPDKENFTPNTLKQRSTKNANILEAIKLLDPLCLSPPTKNSICWNFVQNEELTFSSDKENHTPKVLQKSRIVQAASKNSATLNVEPATKNKISRIPFKSLLSNSSGKSCRNDTAIGSSHSGKYAQVIEKGAVGDNKWWIMVADTNCLLNKVPRKALQLLQGVKGTRLIIPRVVIRELDCMKRRGYLFTRTTEISSALQWIEDCMINTNWWIHVESLEEGRHFTPAPSLSTYVGEIEDLAFSSSSFSAFLNFPEIVSPTPGDHILECALLNRNMKNDENLVILSDDVSLKIKAMAEGIICEAAEEFRESLVNPFSDRFLWAKSSPRGLTWSCEDDIVLREKYYRGPFKKPASKSGESLKGLKLILVQNSHLSGLIPNSLELKCF